MNFEKDIFISYAHIDNEALRKDETGWVADLHRALEIRLSQLLGERPNIWRDKKLQGNDFFGDEIIDQFPKTAILLSIISPRYMKSEWCIREIEQFKKVAESNIGLRVGNKSRIIKVIKTPVPISQHPEFVRDVLGYEFYTADYETGKHTEYSQAPEAGTEREYWQKLDDLAHDIAKLITEIRSGNITPAGSAANTSKNVYLAEAGSELRDERDNIKRELISRGYTVYPDKYLPPYYNEYITEATELMSKCKFSIHPIGTNFGIVPDGTSDSVIGIQNKIGADLAKSSGLIRFIWIPSGTVGTDQRQIDFLTKIRTDNTAQYGADLIETGLADFKFILTNKIKEIELAESAKSIKPKVYLPETNAALLNIRAKTIELLQEKGFTVLAGEQSIFEKTRFISQIAKNLSQTDYAIHIIGDNQGLIPENDDTGIIKQQIAKAAELSEQANLKNLFVFTEVSEKTQNMLVEAEKITAKKSGQNRILHIEAENAPTSSIEKLEALIKENTEKKVEKPKVVQEKSATSKVIYLICEMNDIDSIGEVDDFLYNAGYETILPVFDGDETQLRNDHQENLKICDAVLIYFGEGNDLWLRAKTRELLKIAGYGRTEPLRAKAVYIAGPENEAKTKFRTRELTVIDGLQGLDQSLFNEFFETLTADE